MLNKSIDFMIKFKKNNLDFTDITKDERGLLRLAMLQYTKINGSFSQFVQAVKIREINELSLYLSDLGMNCLDKSMSIHKKRQIENDDFLNGCLDSMYKDLKKEKIYHSKGCNKIICDCKSIFDNCRPKLLLYLSLYMYLFYDILSYCKIFDSISSCNNAFDVYLDCKRLININI